MASRKYLNLSFSYVPSWDYIDAIREIFQNSLDAEVEDSENKMYFEYDKDTCILSIGNKNGRLEESTLLLGKSSKREDENQIGQHGEGYKVATVVLLREGLGVKIFNQNKKQVWVAKSVKSRTYKEDIPVFDIEHQIFKKGADLVFEISGLTEEMFENVVNSNLWLIERYKGTLGDVKVSENGKVLLDEQFKHKIFVKGLYVCDNQSVNYGYDFQPRFVKLDRDRHLVDTFDILWNASRVIAYTRDEKFIKGCLILNDGKYLSNYEYCISNELKNSVATDFFLENGQGSVPCVDENEFNDAIRSGHKAVLVSEPVAKFIKSSPIYVDTGVRVKSLKEQLQDWYYKVADILDDDEYKELLEEGSDLISRVSSQI